MKKVTKGFLNDPRIPPNFTGKFKAPTTPKPLASPAMSTRISRPDNIAAMYIKQSSYQTPFKHLSPEQFHYSYAISALTQEANKIYNRKVQEAREKNPYHQTFAASVLSQIHLPTNAKPRDNYDECWLWTGQFAGRNPSQPHLFYPTAMYNSKKYNARAFMHTMFNEFDPNPRSYLNRQVPYVHNLCGVSVCLNPRHLASFNTFPKHLKKLHHPKKDSAEDHKTLQSLFHNQEDHYGPSKRPYYELNPYAFYYPRYKTTKNVPKPVPDHLRRAKTEEPQNLRYGKHYQKPHFQAATDKQLLYYFNITDPDPDQQSRDRQKYVKEVLKPQFEDLTDDEKVAITDRIHGRIDFSQYLPKVSLPKVEHRRKFYNYNPYRPAPKESRQGHVERFNKQRYEMLKPYLEKYNHEMFDHNKIYDMTVNPKRDPKSLRFFESAD